MMQAECVSFSGQTWHSQLFSFPFCCIIIFVLLFFSPLQPGASAVKPLPVKDDPRYAFFNNLPDIIPHIHPLESEKVLLSFHMFRIASRSTH